MPAFFERLASTERFYFTPPAFLQTHPVTKERIADSLNRIGDVADKQYANDQNFPFVKVLTQVDTASDPFQMSNTFKTLLTSHPENLIDEYGLALSYAKQHRYKAALTLLEKLKARLPTNIFITYSLANTYLTLNKTAAALAILKPILENDSENYPLQLLIARAQQANGDLKAAVITYRELIRKHPLNPAFYTQLANTLAADHKRAEAYYNRARAMMMSGDLKNANVLLHNALKQKPLPANTRAQIYLLLKKLQPLLSRAH